MALRERVMPVRGAGHYSQLLVPQKESLPSTHRGIAFCGFYDSISRHVDSYDRTKVQSDKKCVLVFDPAASDAVIVGAARPGRSVHAQPIDALLIPDALLKMRTVNDVTGLSPATIYRKVAAGEFPAPIRLGSRCTRWRALAVRHWLATQTASSSIAGA
jgi:prophage regulatory protein